MVVCLSEASWLEYWGLKYNPFTDFPLGSPDHQRYLVITKSMQLIHPEIETIIHSPVGVVKPVVGARGSGKTSWLFYLQHNLRDHRKVFSIYVNMYRSISTIKEALSVVSMEKYVLNDLLNEILTKMRAVTPSLFQEQKWIENIAKNIITVPSPEKTPAISLDNLFDILQLLKGKGYEAFVFGIDELDKLTVPGDPMFEKLVIMVCDFFGTQQGLFQKLASEYRTSIYISCDEKLMDPFKRRGLTYLSNLIPIKRMDQDEVKKLIEARLSEQNEVFPFNDDCIKVLTSYFQGNPREIIFRCADLMKEAAKRGLKEIDGKLAKEIFLNVGLESFRKDFQELAITKESSTGARMLWRISSRFPAFQDRVQAFRFITEIYSRKEVENPPEHIVEYLKDSEYIISSPSPTERFKYKLDENLSSFFNYWIKRGHTIEDFIEWYSEYPEKPETYIEIDKKVQSLLSAIKDENVQNMISKAYDIYVHILDRQMHNQMVILKSWTMLETTIKAYCLEAGIKDFILSYTEEQSDKHMSPDVKFRRKLMQLFTLALKKKRTRLVQLGSIKTICEIRNDVVHGGYMPKDAEADITKKNAKMSFEEIISKWKVGKVLVT